MFRFIAITTLLIAFNTALAETCVQVEDETRTSMKLAEVRLRAEMQGMPTVRVGGEENLRSGDIQTLNITRTEAAKSPALETQLVNRDGATLLCGRRREH